MYIQKIFPLVTGAIKHIPGIKSLLSKSTGGTNNARYCYSVWLRHLHFLNRYNNNKIPEVIAELGPGDSIGIGLSALLSGAKKLFLFDVIDYTDKDRNLKVFDEIYELFKNRASIPDNNEFPKVKPFLENYSFPSDVLTNKVLDCSLDEFRIEKIRNEIKNITNESNEIIHYRVPWYEYSIIDEGSIDLIYSQAVLEHIDDLKNTYEAMAKWLKPNAFMSHTIDFKSHGITKLWNGHWLFNHLEWEIVKGGKVYLLNRQPLSKHINLHKEFNFNILFHKKVEKTNEISNKYLAKEFRTLSDEDLTTTGVYILSKKDIVRSSE